MDVFRTFSVLCGAGALTLLLAGCSTTPPKADTTPTKPVESAPKTVIPATPTPVPTSATTAPGSVSKPPATSTPAPVTVAKPKPEPKPAASKQIAPTPVAVINKPQSKPAISKPKPTVTAPVVEKPESKTIAPESSVALITPTPAPTQAPVVETIAVALDKLPITIHGQWVLDRNETQCMLQNTPLKMDDGQGGTRVTFLLAPGSLMINTDSDIDLSYKGTGIKIDQQQPFALEDIDHRTNLSFSKQRQAILASMKTGRSMELTLGFWPTWPVTQTYSVNISLEHFATAMKAWENCNQLMSRN